MGKRNGRKRKTGMRYESGRLLKSESSGPIVPPEALRKRVQTVGLDDALSAAGGRAPSALAAWGIISEVQRQAAERYRRVYEHWRQTQGMPNRHGLPAYYPVAATPDEPLTVEQTRRRAEWALMTPEEQGAEYAREAAEAAHNWREASRVVSSIWPASLARGVTEMVCIEDVAPDTWSRAIVAVVAVKALKDALSALVVHFDIQDDQAA